MQYRLLRLPALPAHKQEQRLSLQTGATICNKATRPRLRSQPSSRGKTAMGRTLDKHILSRLPVCKLPGYVKPRCLGADELLAGWFAQVFTTDGCLLPLYSASRRYTAVHCDYWARSGPRSLGVNGLGCLMNEGVARVCQIDAMCWSVLRRATEVAEICGAILCRIFAR